MTSPSRTEVRRALRAARRAISPSSRRAAARSAARALAASGWLRPGRRLSGYVATAEEFDCAPLMEIARRLGMELFVPQIAARRLPAMRFAPLTPPLRRNRYGLLEPAASRTLSAIWLDVVLLPLVGFDAKGARIGMGAGFYDRALAFRHRRSRWRGPRLIGVGFGVQQLESIPTQPWDVRLDGVLTEQGLTIFPGES